MLIPLKLALLEEHSQYFDNPHLAEGFGEERVVWEEARVSRGGFPTHFQLWVQEKTIFSLSFRDLARFPIEATEFRPEHTEKGHLRGPR